MRPSILVGLLCAMVSPLASAAVDPDSFPECTQEKREVRPIARPEPYFPHSALMFCVDGHVQARFVIGADGRVGDVEIVESEPEGVFDRAARRALSQWLFIPACREGQPADREALQTIEFRIPEDQYGPCQRRLAAMDERTGRLFADLAALYALLAEVQLGHAPIERLADAIAQPMPDYPGDLAAVAEFHQATLEDIHASYYSERPADEFSELMQALLPGNLEADGGLQRLQSALTDYQVAFRTHVEERRASYVSLAERYRTLETTTDLSKDALSLLVGSFLGELGNMPPVEEVMAEALAPLDPLQTLSDVLVLDPGSWRVEDGTLVFEDPADQAIWVEAMKATAEGHAGEQDQWRQWMRSFRDYAD